MPHLAALCLHNPYIRVLVPNLVTVSTLPVCEILISKPKPADNCRLGFYLLSLCLDQFRSSLENTNPAVDVLPTLPEGDHI